MWIISTRNGNLQKDAEVFTRQFFCVYLEERDFDGLLHLLHPEVTWFSTSSPEAGLTYDQTIALLAAERETWQGGFRISHYRAQVVPTANEFCTVFGSMTVTENVSHGQARSANARFSVVCAASQGSLRAYHVDYSLSDLDQREDPSGHETLATAHRALLDSYSHLLEVKLAERTAELEQKARELESLANSVSGGLELCDLDEAFTIRYMSDGFLKLLGFSREELMGTSHVDLVHPADKSLVVGQILRQLESGNEFSTTYRAVCKDGSVRWVLDNGTVCHTTSGDKQVQCFLMDITAQKAQEEELRISQKRYDVALRQLDVSMFEYNIETKQLFLYEREASLYGMATVIDNGPQTLAETGHFDPECVPGYLEMYRKICSGEESVARCLMTTHDVDGKAHEFELTLTAVVDELGKPIRAIGVKKGVSNRLKLQREEEFGKTMTGMRSFICEADVTNNRILRIDPTWQSYLEVVDVGDYAKALAHTAKRYEDHGYRAYLTERLDAARLVSILEQGRHLEQFSFQKDDLDTGGSVWHEVTVNIIRDGSSGNVCVRIYHEDVSERKRKEVQAEDERRLYESMVAKAMVAYEVNVSRDLVLSGHENWDVQYGIEEGSCYSDMIIAFSRFGMDLQDSGRFLGTFERQEVFRAYYGGARELSCQYRKRDERGDLIWVECTMHLFEDPDDGDIRGYAYVENIDKQKRAELDLRYKAEHDAHTDLYNRETTVTLIGQFLESDEGKEDIHAFFMIDLDHFKNINDYFGHLFGDRVIAEMGQRIRALFRANDVVGRLGGDEFCVFMKHAGDLRTASERAEKLCRALVQTYRDDNHSCTVSASVGIALCPSQGRNFEELYRCADNALYEAKRKGRSCSVMAS